MVTPINQIRNYVVGINKRRVGVLLLLVLVLLALGLGSLDDGGDGDNLDLLPESELEITEETSTPVTTETPTPTPDGGGGGDGTGDRDSSNSGDVQIENTDDSESGSGDDDSTPDGETDGQNNDRETDRDNDNSLDTENNDHNEETGPESRSEGGGGGAGGGDGDGGDDPTQEDDDHDGHLYLEVVGDRLRVQATNVLPGDEGSESATIRNNGTVNGTLLAAFDNVTDTENGLTEPEMEAGDDSSDGELSEHLRVRLSVHPEGGDREYLFGNETEDGYVRLDDIAGNNMTDGVLDADENATVTLDWRLPEETGNEVQSDRVTFDLIFYLIHNEQGV